MKIGKEMTSGERFKNKWFYMKYTGKYILEWKYFLTVNVHVYILYNVYIHVYTSILC